MLQKQSLPINFENGMDTKTDTAQLDLGKMYQIKNGVYTSPRKIQKRGGYNAYSKYDSSGNEITDLQSLAVLDNELVSFSDTRLYAHSDSIEKWVDKGAMFNVSVDSTPVKRGAYTATKLHSACVNGVAVFVWKDSRNGCRYSVSDLTTGTLFQSEVELSSTAEDPRVVVNANEFYLFYRESAVMKYKKINSATPTLIGSAVTVKSNLDTAGGPRYDVKTVGNRIYVAYNSTVGGSKLQLFYINTSDTLSSAIGFNVSATECISVYGDSLDQIWVSYHNATSVFTLCRNYNLNVAILGVTTVETIADVENISVIETAVGTITLLYTIVDSPASDSYIKKNTVTTAGTVGSASVFLRSVGQASKIFSNADINYTLVVHDSTLQATYFLVDLDGVIQAKISPATGGTLVAQDSLPEINLISGDTFLATTQVKSIIGALDVPNSSTLGVTQNIINFTPTVNYQDSSLGQNLYVTGGVLKNYDGNTVTEDNFFLYPEGLVASVQATTGGSAAEGTYQYVALYSWFDNKGQLHRSAPSVPVTLTVASGGSSQIFQCEIPTLRLTQKTNASVELYRTENAGTIFYAVGNIATPTFNDKTVNTVTIQDSSSDADLLDNEPLYTTGGILDNNQAPNASLVVNWKNRLVLAGLEERDQIAYSKLYNSGSPAEFSDALRIAISNQGGPVTALGVLDDKLIIFKKALIFLLVGNGPNNAGEQNDFETPQLIASDVGCSDPASLVVTPFGLMFKSDKGIHLLDRGLSTSYIGAEVEAYNQYTVTAASLIPDANQVRFLTNNDYCLTFDTFFKKWSIFDNHGGKDSEVIRGQYVYLRQNEDLVYKQDSSFLDNGEPISLEIDTGWLSFAGVQGFQRVYKFLALGEFFSAHKLIIKTAFNYQNVFTESKTIDSESFINSETYGDGSPYGSDTYYGGDSGLNAYQFRVDIKSQKSQSIRITIKESQNDVYGRGLSLSNLNFQVGVKSGTGKINQSQGFGTN
jgi:hypothetical protein